MFTAGSPQVPEASSDAAIDEPKSKETRTVTEGAGSSAHGQVINDSIYNSSSNRAGESGHEVKPAGLSLTPEPIQDIAMM